MQNETKYEDSILRRLEVIQNHLITPFDESYRMQRNEASSNRSLDSSKTTHCPIHRPEGYELRNYQHVKTIFDTSPDKIAARRRGLDIFEKLAEKHPQVNMVLSWVSFQDGETHDVLKSQYLAYISVKKVEDMKSTIEKIVDDLLSRLPKGVPIDLQSQFSRQLSTNMICHFCGLNRKYVPLLIAITDKVELAMVTFQEKNVLDAVPMITELYNLTANLLEETRSLLSKSSSLPLTGNFADHQHETFALRLLQKEKEGSLSKWQVQVILSAALFAGNGTTSHFISNSLYALLKHPDQMQLLRKNPALTKQAVEELLRYIGTPTIFQRFVVDQISIGGVTAQSQEMIALNVRAANLDPEKYDDPEKLDILRNTTIPHLTFGSGKHICPGRNLARLEAEVALNEILKRFPSLEFAVEPSAIKFRKLQSILILEELPIVLK